MKHLLLLLLSSLLYIDGHTQHNGGQAFLGISERTVSRAKAKALDYPNDDGAHIKYVYNGTAARAAGIEPFDYIIQIGNHQLNNNNDLSDILSKFRPNDEVVVRLIRQNKTLNIPVKLGISSDSNGKHQGGSAILGITKHPDNNDNQRGVTIRTSRGRSAIKMGLDDGDIITAINGYIMFDWGDITVALNNMDAGDPIEINFLRQEVLMRASGAVGGNEDAQSIHKRGFLGIYTGDMTPKKAKILGFEHPHGAYIKHIIPETGAKKAGLETQDYIIAIDNYELNAQRSLTNALSKFTPGTEVNVTFIRDNKEQQTKVTLGQSSNKKVSPPCKDSPFFGVSARNNTPSARGVAVNIVKNSAALEAGLMNGDVIISMRGKPVIDWGDISGLIASTQVGETFSVVYLRNKEQLETTVTMGTECDTNGNSRNTNKWYDYNYDYSFGSASNVVADEPLVDMKRLLVTMNDVSSTYLDSLASKNVQLQNTNDLNIENIQLSPNPNQNMFRLEFDLPQSGQTSVRVFNNSARLIYSFDLGQYQGHFSDDIDISQNGIGEYYLEIKQGKYAIAKTILLQY